jgi:hypothetical protein
MAEATSLLRYYGPSAGPEGLQVKMVVAPEEVRLAFIWTH